MRVEIQFLDEQQYEHVAYYTAKVEGNSLAEFHDFHARMLNGNPKDKRQLAELDYYLKQIGRFEGAQDYFFKREGHADRLPPPTYRFIESDGETDYGLRLYCIVINPSMVILLNGDRKTSQSVKDCPNCYPHFLFANKLSDAIHLAVQRDEVEIDGRDFLTEDGYMLTM